MESPHPGDGVAGPGLATGVDGFRRTGYQPAKQRLYLAPRPAGYSAWYAALAEQGIPVQRWQRPVEDLLQQLE
ncbi:MAG: DUF4350 domain-containing protein, partial [Leptolyngbyaceae cyanobacterium SM2_5_2]|nr:DUF4350 domain-containing protein [Leptolyngbyaceae cyanobacterium SM2_5_2]